MQIKIIFISLLLFSGICAAQDTLHFMSYNLLNYYGSAQDSATRNPYFRTTMSATHPDIITTLEIATESSSLGFLNGVLKKVDTTYHSAPFVPGPDTNSSLYFLSNKYSCNSNAAIHTALRDINHYTVVQLQTNDTVHVFVVHLKASSGTIEEADRLAEVNELRLITDAFPIGTSFIVCGDFNFYNSTESGYQRLKENTGANEGYVIDPIVMNGTWNNSSFAQYHTQSPRTRSFGGGITGGLDDRFDLILFSNSIYTNGPVRYIPNSTIAYGNDGNHFNDSVNHQPNTAVSFAVANALHYGADHLPVMAKFVFVNGWANGVSPQLTVGSRQFSIFPNPARSQFTVYSRPLTECCATTESTIAIYDLVGRKILTEQFIDEKIISLENISAGIYFVQVSDGDKTETKKLLVE
ncbi:MAG: T9SS C-terminal target domain-containing protein [Sphingobacteriales bacterium]|nr:MAG: T9SS C-terminal target domain-containing protein [Sphingobacteriales bacterium]